VSLLILKIIIIGDNNSNNTNSGCGFVYISLTCPENSRTVTKRLLEEIDQQGRGGGHDQKIIIT